MQFISSLIFFSELPTLKNIEKEKKEKKFVIVKVNK